MDKVLIVIDMQRDFINGSLGTKEAQEIVPKVCKRMEDHLAKGGYVFLTRDIHGYDYEKTLEGRKLPVRHCIEMTPGMEFDDAVSEIIKRYPNQCLILSKRQFGFMNWWQKLDVRDEIMICGLCTDVCVLVNAIILRSEYPNTRITLYADSCAGTTPEKHEAALNVMESCHIEVIK